MNCSPPASIASRSATTSIAAAKSCRCCENEAEHRQAGQFSARGPGRELAVVTAPQRRRVAVISLLGRVFMRPVDCPFHAADRVLAEMPAEVRVDLVDFHAEATSDKQLMGRYLDGRVTRRAGHAHACADGRRADLARRHGLPMRRGHDRPARKHPGPADRSRDGNDADVRPTQFDVADGDVRISGSIVDVDPETGRATAIRRVMIDEAEARRLQEKKRSGCAADLRLLHSLLPTAVKMETEES